MDAAFDSPPPLPHPLPLSFLPYPYQQTTMAPKLGNSGKKICCACPETREVRDKCIMEKGEADCAAAIWAHVRCLRADGFTLPDPTVADPAARGADK
jgi:cytochrome c oxidase assembly protein subunit 17